MKRIILLALIVVATISAHAQSTNGVYITPSLTFNNFDNRAPSKTLVGEVGYFGSILGVAGLYQSDRHYNYPQVGLKLYAQLFTIENIKIKAFGAVKGNVKDYKGNPIELEPGLVAFVPLVGRFGARLSGSALFHDNTDKVHPAANFGLTYKLF